MKHMLMVHYKCSGDNIWSHQLQNNILVCFLFTQMSSKVNICSEKNTCNLHVYCLSVLTCKGESWCQFRGGSSWCPWEMSSQYYNSKYTLLIILWLLNLFTIPLRMVILIRDLTIKLPLCCSDLHIMLKIKIYTSVLCFGWIVSGLSIDYI